MDKSRFYSSSVPPLSAVLSTGYGTGTEDAKTGGSLSPSQNPERPELLEQLVTSNSIGSGQGIQGETGGDEFTLVAGGSLDMGGPGPEAWRSQDETQCSVTVDDFHLPSYEVTQDEYRQTVGTNPSSFIGENLPVEVVSWLDAVSYCNTRNGKEGLEPVYEIGNDIISQNRSASGYGLPTEAEWEYTYWAGTMIPFNTQTFIGMEEANYWKDYLYMIEDSYFSQGNLETKPGVYRQTTTAMGSLQPSAWGFHDMHGDAGEQVWDCYGSYDSTDSENPTGPDNGARKVNRGGGWNDFVKNPRSAYCAIILEGNKSCNIDFHLARDVAVLSGTTVTSKSREKEDDRGGRVLIAYSSWRGNTRGIAREIERQTGADFSKIEYDPTGEVIIPFCSHGGGRLGWSLTAIARLAPATEIREGLVISYSGSDRISGGVAEWLEQNSVDVQ